MSALWHCSSNRFISERETMLKLETPGKMQIGTNGFIISVVNHSLLLQADTHDLMIWVDGDERAQVPLNGLDNEICGLSTDQILDVLEFVRDWYSKPGLDLPVMASYICQLIAR